MCYIFNIIKIIIIINEFFFRNKIYKCFGAKLIYKYYIKIHPIIYKKQILHISKYLKNNNVHDTIIN